LPLLAVAEHGYLAVVQKLLGAGADRNASKEDGEPVLCVAIKATQGLVVKELPDLGVKLDETNPVNEQTPLQLALELDEDIWGMVLHKEEEGKLAEKEGDGDHELHSLFEARLTLFTREYGRIIYKSEMMPVATPLSDSRLKTKLASSSFRRIHLPANKVS
jgi:hypothetical protein